MGQIAWLNMAHLRPSDPLGQTLSSSRLLASATANSTLNYSSPVETSFSGSSVYSPEAESASDDAMTTAKEYFSTSRSDDILLFTKIGLVCHVEIYNGSIHFYALAITEGTNWQLRKEQTSIHSS